LEGTLVGNQHPTELQFASDISTIIADYQQVLEPRTADEVIHFIDRCAGICQWMTAEDRLCFLSALRTSLHRFYWSASRVHDYLDSLLRATDLAAAGHWQLLYLQETESSQGRLLNFASRSPGLDVVRHLNDQCDNYIYIDDATYTGRTLKRYLEQIVEQVLTLSPRKRHLWVWHVFEYGNETQQGILDVRQRLAGLGIDLQLCRIADLGTRRGPRPLGVLWPETACRNSPVVQRYVQSTDALRKFVSNVDATWRAGAVQMPDAVFTDPAERRILERVFLEVGCHLLLRTRSKNPYLRPLGYVADLKQPSLGFGSMFCTFQNSPNTGPLALWWGDPTAQSALSLWEPLLPRKV
jgi:hypothetical protein